MKNTFFLVLFCSLFVQSYSQDQPLQESPKNVIHASLGTFVLVNSAQITYDRLLAENKETFFTSYYLTLKAGGNVSLDFSGNKGGTGILTSLGATVLTGKGNKHFELGLGLGYFSETVKSDDFIEGEDSLDNTLYPSISIGYRYQTAKGFMFRTGVGIAEWAFVGFGYSF